METQMSTMEVKVECSVSCSEAWSSKKNWLTNEFSLIVFALSWQVWGSRLVGPDIGSKGLGLWAYNATQIIFNSRKAVYRTVQLTDSSKQSDRSCIRGLSEKQRNEVHDPRGRLNIVKDRTLLVRDYQVIWSRMYPFRIGLRWPIWGEGWINES